MMCTSRTQRNYSHSDRYVPFTARLAIGLLPMLMLLPGCNYAVLSGAQAHKDNLAPLNDWEGTSKDPAINANTYYAAGQLAEANEEWGRAVQCYQKALTVDHDHKASLFRLGVIYARYKHYKEAMAQWDHYLKVTEGDPTGYANLGFCHELAGEYNEAQLAYEAGIRRDPNNAPCRMNYGLLLARRGRIIQAAREWAVVLPEAEVHYNVGSAYETFSKRELARVEYHKALALDPSLADAQTRLDTLDALYGKGSPAPTAVVAAPTTAPATEPVAVAPATEPVAAVTPVLEPTPTTEPATQPTVAANPGTDAVAPDPFTGEMPATAPSPVAVAPATQPTTTPTAAVAVAPATQPTTAPAVAVAPATQPTTSPAAAVAETPATQPATQPTANIEIKF